MNWLEPWMLLALLYLVLWHATKRFRWSDEAILAFLFFTKAIADQVWWLFIVGVLVDRVLIYVAEIERLKRELAKQGLETLAELGKERRFDLIYKVVNDATSIGELATDFPFLRNTKRWHALLTGMLQIGAYFLIQEVRQPGYFLALFRH